MRYTLKNPLTTFYCHIMGTCSSSQADTLDTNVGRARSSEQDHQVKSILILGSTGSGKTTLCKQLHRDKRFRHINNPGRGHRLSYLPYIHEQCIKQMQLALDALERRIMFLSGYIRESEYIHSIAISSDVVGQIFMFHHGYRSIPNLSSFGMIAANFIQNCNPISAFGTIQFNDMVVAALRTLWAEPVIKKLYEMRSGTNIEDSSGYFWNMLDVLNEHDFVPEMDHIMRLSRPTSGIEYVEYVIHRQELQRIS